MEALSSKSVAKEEASTKTCSRFDPDCISSIKTVRVMVPNDAQNHAISIYSRKTVRRAQETEKSKLGTLGAEIARPTRHSKCRNFAQDPPPQCPLKAYPGGCANSVPGQVEIDRKSGCFGSHLAARAAAPSNFGRGIAREHSAHIVELLSGLPPHAAEENRFAAH